MENDGESNTSSGQLNYLLKVCPCKTIFIAGSYGKTSCALLVSELLRHAGYVVGNEEARSFESDEAFKGYDFIVLKVRLTELSDLTGSPTVAVVTNLLAYPLESGTSYNELIQCCCQLLCHGPGCKWIIVNRNYRFVYANIGKIQGDIIEFGTFGEMEKGAYLKEDELVLCLDGTARVAVRQSELLLPGIRNMEIYLAAIAAAGLFMPVEAMGGLVRQFKGAPSHYEYVRNLNGVTYYNNADSLLPSHAVTALIPFEQRIIFITGGDVDPVNPIPYKGLGLMIVSYVKKLIVIGDSSDDILTETSKIRKYSSEKLKMVKAVSLQDAVLEAHKEAVEGDVVLFSPITPICFGETFAGTGDVFRKAVNQL